MIPTPPCLGLMKEVYSSKILLKFMIDYHEIQIKMISSYPYIFIPGARGFLYKEPPTSVNNVSSFFCQGSPIKTRKNLWSSSWLDHSSLTINLWNGSQQKLSLWQCSCLLDWLHYAFSCLLGKKKFLIF